MKRHLSRFLFYIIVFQCTLSVAQSISYDDLLNIQKHDLEKIKGFLGQTGWEFYSSKVDVGRDYFDYNLECNLVGWSYKKSYYEDKALGWLYLYQANGYENVLIFQTTEYYIKILEKEAKSRLTHIETVAGENELKTIYQNSFGIEFSFVMLKDEGNDEYYDKTYYSVIVLNRSDFDKRVKELKEKKEYDNFLAMGDTDYNTSNFENAKINYEKALNLKPIENYPKEKISEIKLLIVKNESYNSLIKAADKSFNAKEYSDAIEYYEDALSVKPNEKYPKTKISEVKDAQLFFTERKTKIYNYPDYNKNHWEKINNSLTKDINNFFSNKDLAFNGTISYTYYIDTLGKTTRGSSSESQTDVNIANSLRNLGSNYSLEPVYKQGYTFNAKGELKMTVLFDKKKNFTVKKRYNNITKNEINNEKQAVIYDLLSKTNAKGKFKVQILTRKINDVDYSENKIIGYKHIGGPSNAFLSLLIPGLGDKFVYENNKGLAIAIFTYGLIGAGVGAKFYSISEYDKYHKATTQTDIDKYYDNANRANYAFYGLLAGGAALWVTDIIKVAAKGFKNRKEGKIYKSQIGLSYNPVINSIGLSCSIKL